MFRRYSRRRQRRRRLRVRKGADNSDGMEQVLTTPRV